MGDAEELDLLRARYELAMAGYEAACSTLNRQLVAGVGATQEDLQRERQAKVALDAARRSYLDAWLLP
jgi:hypothetical protein